MNNLLLRRRAMGVEAGYWETIIGVSPLLLSSALRSNIKSLVQTGLCTQASTPTPSDPVPIKCNNGTIVARRQSGLPTGYQLLEWLGSTKGIETARPTTNNTEIRAKWYRKRNNAQYAYVSDSGASLTTNTTAYLSRTGNWRFGSDWYALDAVDQTIYESIQNKNGIWLNGGKIATYTNVGTFTSESNLRLLGTNQYSDATQLYWLEHYERGVLVAKYLPVKRLSDNAYGFYDLVGDAFYTNAEATFTAGADVSDPVEIAVVGTPEVITVSASGADDQTASVANLLSCGDYADEQEIISGVVTRRIGILVFDGTESWGAGSAGSGYRKMSLTIPDMMPEGGAEVSGFCTHYKWEYANTVGNFYFAATGAVLQIVEESSKSLSAFKAWLAEQYAAGTPVIVLYPLAEPTTESVTPQPLRTSDGNNVITVNANVSPVNLNVIFKKVS